MVALMSPHEGIQKLHPYVPGKSIDALAKEKGLKDIVKLASNENPLGCSPRVMERLRALRPEELASYPDPRHHPIIDALATHLGVSEENLFLCNGSDALFTLLLNLSCLHQGKYLLTHAYAFASYVIQAQTYGVDYKVIPLAESLCVNVDDLIAACNEDTGIIMFANPNNPTGTTIPVSEIERLLQAVPQSVMVLVDEAYCEFAYDSQEKSALSLLKDYPNLLISRTFSKIYGLANVRLGYAIAHPESSALLWKVQLPFALSGIALETGLAALPDQDFVQESLALNARSMKDLQATLQGLGLPVLPSNCNFLTFDCQCSAQELNSYLLDRGVIVRPLSGYGLPQHIRVSLGTEYQNQRFSDSISAFYEEKKNARI